MPCGVIGIDTALGLAEIRATNDGTPLPFGTRRSYRLDDPVVLLASPQGREPAAVDAGGADTAAAQPS